MGKQQLLHSQTRKNGFDFFGYTEGKLALANFLIDLALNMKYSLN